MKIKKKLEDLVLYKFKNTKKVNEIKKDTETPKYKAEERKGQNFDKRV